MLNNILGKKKAVAPGPPPTSTLKSASQFGSSSSSSSSSPSTASGAGAIATTSSYISNDSSASDRDSSPTGEMLDVIGLVNGRPPTLPSHTLSGSNNSSSSNSNNLLPRADVGLPVGSSARRERRRSSTSSAPGGGVGFTSFSHSAEAAISEIVDSQLLKDAPPAKREALFLQKLSICSIMGVRWNDPLADVRAKEIKRNTLMELVEHLGTLAGQKILSENTYSPIISMVSANIMRALPPSASSSSAGEEGEGGGAVAVGTGEGEDDELSLEPSWPHLELVYEFLLRFVTSQESKVKTAKKQIDAVFCTKLIELFDSEDPREREYLKTILHRIYGKFLSHRSAIRKAISNVFFQFVFETERHNGIAELLEILGSIINGFALPLKEEHVSFLERSLLPLHRQRNLAAYQPQLQNCMEHYIEKDPSTIVYIVRGLARTWPSTYSSKQILMLNELESLLVLAGAEATEPVLHELFQLLSRCCGSSHFQVADRALMLWDNDELTASPSGSLSAAYGNVALPILFDGLQKQMTLQEEMRKKAPDLNRSNNVENNIQRVISIYCEADASIFSRVQAQRSGQLDRNKNWERWDKLEKQLQDIKA
jgi:serine/threonine-protein phosphatase 2A regulatory subunit B'